MALYRLCDLPPALEIGQAQQVDIECAQHRIEFDRKIAETYDARLGLHQPGNGNTETFGEILRPGQTTDPGRTRHRSRHRMLEAGGTGPHRHALDHRGCVAPQSTGFLRLCHVSGDDFDEHAHIVPKGCDSRERLS